MGFARTYSVALVGLRGHIVDVEADISQGLPGFVLLGLPDTALNESKERVRSAAKNTGITLTQHRLTVNLTPATLPKRGSAFDLAIVVAALQAEKKLHPSGDSVSWASWDWTERYAPCRASCLRSKPPWMPDTTA